MRLRVYRMLDYGRPIKPIIPNIKHVEEPINIDKDKSLDTKGVDPLDHLESKDNEANRPSSHKETIGIDHTETSSQGDKKTNHSGLIRPKINLKEPKVSTLDLKETERSEEKTSNIESKGGLKKPIVTPILPKITDDRGQDDKGIDHGIEQKKEGKETDEIKGISPDTKGISEVKDSPQVNKGTGDNDKNGKESVVEEPKKVKVPLPKLSSSLPIRPVALEEQEEMGVPKDDKGTEETNKGVDKKKELLPPSAANDLVVTNNGLSLEEYLLSKRKGNKSTSKHLQDKKDGLLEVEVLGKTKSDNRYTKGARKQTEELSQEELRKRAAKRFLQRNAKYTEEEKIIMKSLGLSGSEYEKVMRSSSLTSKDKKELMDSHKKSVASTFKGKRYRVTIADRDTIEFLAKFKFASVKTLSRLRGEVQSKTWRRLARLKDGGLVGDQELIGVGTIWYLTEAGMAISGYSFTTFTRYRTKTSIMPPIMGANHVASYLWNNQLNILQLEDFPANNRRVEKKDEVVWKRGETLVSELEIRSSLGIQANPTFGSDDGGRYGNMYAFVGNQARSIWHEWDSLGRNKQSPEMEVGNEYLWVLYPKNEMTVTYHVPDIVVKRDRGSDGSPKSIAVEIELNAKTIKKYRETMLAFKLDEDIYEKVVWVTNSNQITKMLIQAAEEVGFDRYDIVPMMNEQGIWKNRDIWNI